jgi:hypothetical protein
MGLRAGMRVHHLGTRDAVQAVIARWSDTATSMGQEMTQPEALRLAGELEDAGKPTDITDAAAVELRRLHAECQRLAGEVANRNRRAIEGDEAVAALDRVHAYYEGLHEVNQALYDALKYMVDSHEPLVADLLFGEAWLEQAKAAITKAEEV